MTSDAVTIPQEEYEFLLKCRHLVEAEFEEHFSPAFVMAVKESEDAYKRGDVVRVKSREERKKLFDSL